MLFPSQVLEMIVVHELPMLTIYPYGIKLIVSESKIVLSGMEALCVKKNLMHNNIMLIVCILHNLN